jgi:2-polyprenyl-3-methyl-5-hydroxy-6-metoxy-1,4-benzoquinol methylase
MKIVSDEKRFNMSGHKITECLLCGNKKLKEVYSFGETPLANEFLNKKDIIQETFPLNLVVCENDQCNHVQLDYIVDQERLYKNYSYVSGTSQVNVKHFKEYAADIMFNYFEFLKFKDGESIHLYEGSKNIKKIILDIGSNDGTFLKCFSDEFIRIGIDPADNLKELAKLNNVDTIVDFFNKQTAKSIGEYILNKYKQEKFKVITCNHMFAHNEDLYTIMEGVNYLLDDNGVFVFENSYLLDILDKNLFDILYHEHCHSHYLKPLINFFKQFNMKIFQVERLPNQQGGSIRVFVCKAGAYRGRNITVDTLIKEEEKILAKLEQFSENIKTSKQDFIEKLKPYINKKIHCYGYPAKTTTLFYTYGIKENDIECCYEDAELKQNTFSPGLHIPIVPVNKLYENKPNVIIVSAWNFAKSIIKNHQRFIKEYNGVFLVPLPKCIIIDKNNIDEYLG